MDTFEQNEEHNGPKLETKPHDDYLEITVKSKTFLRDAAREFQAITDEAIAEGATHFIINFNDCEYISSVGLGCVAEFWRRCMENEGFIMVSVFNSDPANSLLNFFEIIGLSRVMDGHIFTDYQKAEGFLKSEIS